MSWTLTDRARELSEVAAEGVDVLVVGGGITGAGVLRDATLRGLRSVLIERGDFAAGTSSATSKMIHGGLRYLAEAQFRVTRESCKERDQLAALNPNLVWPLPFLFCAFDDGVPPWKVRAGLTLYGALAGFGKTRARMLKRGEFAHYSRDMRLEGLRAAGLYYDAQVDDARFVIEVLKSARRSGAVALPHTEIVGFDKDEQGQLVAAVVRDRLNDETHRIRAKAFVNATGPSADRVRNLDRPLPRQELRPAKGAHLVLRGDRLHARAAVAFQSPRDGRHMFLCPFDDVYLIGTTDAFTERVDEPVVCRAEAEYLLEAANHAFPRAKLDLEDVVSAWAGVRPLVADENATTPASSVSREHRITQDPSGLLSVAGGKLTTFRAMAEQLVDQVVRRFPERQLAACTTAKSPLREDRFDVDEETRRLEGELNVDTRHARRVLQAWGRDACEWLAAAPPAWRAPIGQSRYLYAEVAWAMREECAASLCDVLEHRLRIASLTAGQGLPSLPEIARVAAEAAGWDEARMRREMEAYAERVHAHYTVQP